MPELSCTVRRIGDLESRTEEYEMSYAVEGATPRGLRVKYQAARAYEINAALDAAVETFGGLHGAVNCAGIGTAARVLGRKGPHPLDLFENVIQINLIGTFNVTRLAGARISEGEPKEDGERGVIVNTASVAAYDGQIGQAAYSASKGGVVSNNSIRSRWQSAPDHLP